MTLWNETPFETRLREALRSASGSEAGEAKMANFVTARTKLLNEVLPEIKGAEPVLSDHGPKHIHNVLTNVHLLLPKEGNYFTAVELYVLGMAVLLHDAGNLDGREKHNQRIGKYFDIARQGSAQDLAREKRLVVLAAGAHTGKTVNGSYDTLQDLPQTDHLEGECVRLCELASVLRFADELAEGKQRTSQYLLDSGGYTVDSLPFHRYASQTSVAIDRGNGRIALTYDLLFELKSDLDALCKEVTDDLSFIYTRVSKLDSERKYARYFCPQLLLPFSTTSVRFNFQIDREFVDLGLIEWNLNDKVVPGKVTQLLPELHESFGLPRVAQALRELDLVKEKLQRETPAATAPKEGATNEQESV